MALSEDDRADNRLVEEMQKRIDEMCREAESGDHESRRHLQQA